MKQLTSKIMTFISPPKLTNNRILYDDCIMLMGILLLLWVGGNQFMASAYPLSGSLDPNIWLLIVLSLICFLVVMGICWWLLQRFWRSLGLPDFSEMVSQFKSMVLWQQFACYLCCFALFLLTAVGCLMAIC